MAFVAVGMDAADIRADLEGSTAMPVTAVNDGAILRPNQVYIAPTNTAIAIRQNELLCARRMQGKKGAAPIDSFLASLAEDRGAEAIGVIFAGSSRGGAAGLQAIRKKGGFTFPQGAAEGGVSRARLFADSVAAHGVARAIQGIASRNNGIKAPKRSHPGQDDVCPENSAQSRFSFGDSEVEGVDFGGIIRGLSVPVLILDRYGRIRSMNPAAAEGLHLNADDLGRNITTLSAAAEIPDLEAIVEKVFETLLPWQGEVLDSHGVRYSLRARPYKNRINRVDGVVLEFLNIEGMRQSDEALQHADALARALLNTAPQAILGVNQGQIVLANVAAEATFGFSQTELIGRPLHACVSEGDRALLASYWSGFLASGQSRSRPLEIRGRRRDGSDFPVELTAGVVQREHGHWLLVFVADISERAAARSALGKSTSALQLKQEELLKLTASLLTSQELERRTISRDLQEDLNQKLAVLAVDVDALSQSCSGSRKLGDLRGRMEMLRGQVNDVSDKLRRIAYRLHPSVLEHLGLAVGIRSLCEDYGAKGMVIRFRYGGLPDYVPGDVALGVYRIIQESLSRIDVLGEKQSASVMLAGTSDQIAISVTSPAQFTSPRHPGEVGVLSIIERARLLTGTVAIYARSRGGSRIVIRIPLGTGGSS
jgi:PAS domain S-box-containing protein